MHGGGVGGATQECAKKQISTDLSSTFQTKEVVKMDSDSQFNLFIFFSTKEHSWNEENFEQELRLIIQLIEMFLNQYKLKKQKY